MATGYYYTKNNLNHLFFKFLTLYSEQKPFKFGSFQSCKTVATPCMNFNIIQTFKNVTSLLTRLKIREPETGILRAKHQITRFNILYQRAELDPVLQRGLCHTTMDSAAKRGVKLTSEPFTMILCGPNFVVL